MEDLEPVAVPEARLTRKAVSSVVKVEQPKRKRAAEDAKKATKRPRTDAVPLKRPQTRSAIAQARDADLYDENDILERTFDRALELITFLTMVRRF